MQFKTLIDVLKKPSSPTLFKAHHPAKQVTYSASIEQAVFNMLSAILENNYPLCQQALAELKSSDNLFMARKFFKDLVLGANIRIWLSQSSRVDESPLINALDDPDIFKKAANISEYHFNNNVCRYINIEKFLDYLKSDVRLVEQLERKLLTKANQGANLDNQKSETIVPFEPRPAIKAHLKFR